MEGAPLAEPHRLLGVRKFRERQELTLNAAMAWGSRCEPRILADAGHIIGVPMVRVNHMYESLVYPRMGATIDGWCLPDPMWEVEAHPEFLDGRDERDTGWLAPLRREVYRLGQEYGPGLVEVKMKRQRAIFKPKGGERDPKMLFERGPEAHHETWGIPYQHAYQVQMQLAVLGSRRAGPQWSMLVTNISRSRSSGRSLTVAYVTIYIPDDHRKRMRRIARLDPGVNFSRAAAAGIKRILTMAEKRHGLAGGNEDDTRATTEEGSGDMENPVGDRRQ